MEAVVVAVVVVEVVVVLVLEVVLAAFGWEVAPVVKVEVTVERQAVQAVQP